MVGWFATWKATRARRVDGIDLAETDRLVTDPCPDPQPYGLGLLLDAARAPAGAEELAGEEQTVARLVAARRATVAANSVRRRDAKVPPVVRKIAVGLATGLALLIGVAGIAAETGSLPTALQQRAHDMFSPLGVPAPTGEGDPEVDPSGSPGPGPVPTASATGPSDPSGDPTPTRSTTGPLDPDGAEARALCQAWNAGGRDPDGAGMSGPSWRTLVATAGGKARVPALCAALLGGPSADATDSTGSTDSTDSTGNGSAAGGGPAAPSQSAGGKKRGQP